jgi:TrmH family RNA methyltransferase
MLSKPVIQYLRSLQEKKFRQKYGKFIAEGDKIACEILLQQEYRIERLFALHDWIERNRDLLRQHGLKEVVSISQEELQKISGLSTPTEVLVVLDEPPAISPKAPPAGRWSLALDGIRDPGNMGTILRIADWFGIRQVICSTDCVDLHSPKVIQATMGSFLRIQCPVVDLSDWLPRLGTPVFGALLNGRSMYEAAFNSGGILLIGNESHGIRPHLLPAVTHPVAIPRYGNAESLNAAVATGILCAMALQPPH